MTSAQATTWDEKRRRLVRYRRDGRRDERCTKSVQGDAATLEDDNDATCPVGLSILECRYGRADSGVDSPRADQDAREREASAVSAPPPYDTHAIGVKGRTNSHCPSHGGVDGSHDVRGDLLGRSCGEVC